VLGLYIMPRFPLDFCSSDPTSNRSLISIPFLRPFEIISVLNNTINDAPNSVCPSCLRIMLFMSSDLLSLVSVHRRNLCRTVSLCSWYRLSHVICILASALARQKIFELLCESCHPCALGFVCWTRVSNNTSLQQWVVRSFNALLCCWINSCRLVAEEASSNVTWYVVFNRDMFLTTQRSG